MPIKPIAPAPAGSLVNPPARPRSRTYEVGYGKPPKATQFRKGVSGNPKGRAKQAKTLNTIVREVMLEKVPVRTSRGERKVSRAEALVLKQLELASKGNLRALVQLLQLFQVAVPDQPTASAEVANFDSTEGDLAILAALQAQLFPPSSECSGDEGASS
jgi:hypothetical protein